VRTKKSNPDYSDELLANDKPWNMVESRCTETMLDYGELEEDIEKSMPTKTFYLGAGLHIILFMIRVIPHPTFGYGQIRWKNLLKVKNNL